MKGFWRALERVPGLSAVMSEWQGLMGEDLLYGKPFLRPCPDVADNYPNPNGAGLPFRVIKHGDAYVAVCRDTGETIPLDREEVVVYELDQKRLADRLARSAGIDVGYGVNAWERRLLLLGDVRHSTQVPFVAFLSFPEDERDLSLIIARLTIERRTPFLLLIPTRRFLRRSIELQIQALGSAFVCLDEAVSCRRPGQLEWVNPVLYWIEKSSGLVGTEELADHSNIFRLDKDLWTVSFEGKTEPINDSLGMRYISILIAKKYQVCSASELRASVKGQPMPCPEQGMRILDKEVAAHLRTELQNIENRLQQASFNNDLAAQKQLNLEKEAILGQLRSAFGLGGTPRKMGDDNERHRKSVCNRIEHAITRISDKHSSLAQHLDCFISRGKALSYNPVPDVNWDL